MPGYTKKALKQFGHKQPMRGQDLPFANTKPNYGAKIQYAYNKSTSKPVDKKAK